MWWGLKLSPSGSRLIITRGQTHIPRSQVNKLTVFWNQLGHQWGEHCSSETLERCWYDIGSAWQEWLDSVSNICFSLQMTLIWYLQASWWQFASLGTSGTANPFSLAKEFKVASSTSINACIGHLVGIIFYHRDGVIQCLSEIINMVVDDSWQCCANSKF